MGEDAAEQFLDQVLNAATICRQYLTNKIPMNQLTPQQWQEFNEATTCSICNKAFISTDNKVRDHYHLTGEYRGPAHNACNLKYRVDPQHIKVPCIIHNLRGYGAHLILSAVKPRHGKITAISNNLERYTSFTIGDVRFLDSGQFMLSSLDKLVNNLEKHQFRETRKFLESQYAPPPPQQQPLQNNVMEENEDEQEEMHAHKDYRNYLYQPPTLTLDQQQDVESDLELMTRKRVHPYEYMDSFGKFNERQLPPRDAFYSTLIEKHISDEDYTHADEDLTDFHNFYLMTDVLLLPGVFENFRDVCLCHYGLDPAHNYTSPGLSWQAALKMTDIELELLTDIDQHLFIEEGIRGGVAMITYRYARANNPEMDDYNATRPNSYITYLLIENILCQLLLLFIITLLIVYQGWAMSQALPTSNFKWLDQEELDGLDVTMVPDDGPKGFILECDLEYPPALHEAHKHFPLAPERIRIEEAMLSPYQKHLLQDNGFTKPPPKIIPNLYHKTNYTVHYRNLKLYLDL